MKNTNEKSQIRFTHPWSQILYVLGLNNRIDDKFYNKFGYYLYSGDSKENTANAMKYILNNKKHD